MSDPGLSIVIPAFNEAEIIGTTVREVSAYFRSTGLSYEIIVVDDGSTDGTSDAVTTLGGDDDSIRLISLGSNQGKGAAVRKGVLEAHGEVIAFIDADLPYRVQNLGDAIALVQSGAADIAIGARELRSSESDPSYPLVRKFMGRTFSLFVRFFLDLSVVDTQCGLKAFNGSAARLLFSESRLTSFGFDFEILYLANRFGFRLERIPVTMSHRHESKVRLIRDSLTMLFDIARVLRFDQTMAYRSPRRCPVCFSLEVRTLTQIEKNVLRICRRCKARFLGNFPSSEELERLYADGYFHSADSARKGYGGGLSAGAALKTNERRASIFRRRLPSRARLLEVGSGAGLFGSIVAGEFDYAGIDLSDEGVRSARSKGLNVVKADLSHFVNVGFPFDAVAMFHVFEHLPDPHDALARVRELLKPGGLVVIITPDTESLLCAISGERWVSYKFPEHLILYSRSGLIELLEHSGFEIVSASGDFEHCDHDFLLSRLGQLNPALERLARPLLRILPDPLPVTSGSIRVVAKRRAGPPGVMRSIRAVEPTHAR